MSFPSVWGPYPFGISTDTHPRHITLTQTTVPCVSIPSGTPYAVAIRRDDSADDSSFTQRGTVMLDDNGVIQGFCNPLKHKSWGAVLTNLVGQFDPEGSATKGTWTGDGSQPDVIIDGTWQAGGPGEPFGHPHEHKHGQHA
jgi:hypothetical protein